MLQVGAAAAAEEEEEEEKEKENEEEDRYIPKVRKLLTKLFFYATEINKRF
jgi:ribosomal protein L12E/L44/L45/RPP1/RPP2